MLTYRPISDILDTTYLSSSLKVLLICPSMTYAHYAPVSQICKQKCVHRLQLRPAFLQGRICCCIAAQLGPNNHLTVFSHTSSARPAPFAHTVQAPAATLAWHHAVPHAAAKHC